jgi:hypothetical protein
MQISTGGGFIAGQGSVNVIRVGVNSFFNGSNWTYINSDFASWFETANGSFSWISAPSGIANASFIPSAIMRLFSTGNLAINSLIDSGYRLDVNGTGRFSSSVDIGNSVAAAVAAPSTHKVAILIGGVQYYLLASNV